MNEDEQIIWGQPVSFQDFVQGFQAAPNQRRVELVPKADPQKFYTREKVAPPSQDQGEIRDANKERVNRSLSNYASNNFLLSTSNIRPDQNGRYNPGLGQFAGDQTALTLSMGFDPFNTSNYYKVATQIPKFRNWGLTRLLANELNNEVRVAGELGKNVGSVSKTQFVLPQFKNVTRTVQDNGKIRLSLPSHTDANPRQFVLEPQGNNKFYVHMRTWDGDHIPANLSNEDKQTLFQALYDELPEGGEILFPKSGPGYYGTRGTVAGLQRLSRDSRFTPGTKGTLQYLDKDGTIKTYEGTSFIKSPTIQQEPSTSLRFFTENPKLAKTLTNGQWDAGYLPAVKNKDLVEAQNLRDLHFSTKSGNDNTVFVHTTPNSFTIFDKSYFGRTDDGFNGKGFYFGPTRVPSKGFNYNIPGIVKGPHGEIHTMNYGPNKMYVYLKGKRVFGPFEENRNFFKEPNVVGITDKYLYDNNGLPEIVIGNPKHIKSANTITYDNAQNIIPLSRRDNFISSDIRYQNGGKIIQRFKNYE